MENLTYSLISGIKGEEPSCRRKFGISLFFFSFLSFFIWSDALRLSAQVGVNALADPFGKIHLYIELNCCEIISCIANKLRNPQNITSIPTKNCQLPFITTPLLTHFLCKWRKKDGYWCIGKFLILYWVTEMNIMILLM